MVSFHSGTFSFSFTFFHEVTSETAFGSFELEELLFREDSLELRIILLVNCSLAGAQFEKGIGRFLILEVACLIVF